MRSRSLLFAAALTASPVLAGTPSVTFLGQWPVPGPGGLGGPIDVARAPDGSFLVSNISEIKRFDAAGNPLGQWFLPPTGINPHGSPFLLAVDAAGLVYACAGFGYVQKLTLSGSLITQWKVPGSNGTFGIAVGPDGSVFVGGNSERTISKFDSNGQFLLQWGSEGSGPGQFLTVTGLACDNAGHLFALDSGTNHRVQVFDFNGNYLYEWGSQGSDEGQFEALTDVAVSSSGHVFITDEQSKRVQEFLPNGTFVGVVAGPGSAEDQFQYPTGICADALGNIFVVDFFGQKVVRFGPAPVAATPTSWGRIKADYRGR